MNTIEAQLVATDLKVGIVVGRFNSLIGEKLLAGALDCFKRHGGQEDNLDTVWVPGAFEVPLLAQKMATSGKYQAIVCLGAIIRGSTPHFDFVASEAAKGISKVGLDNNIPTMFGILTTDTIEQAIERAGTKAGNKGWDCMLGAIEMANLMREL